MGSNSVKMVMPQLGSQAQSVQNETISHSSSSQQSVMHPTVTTAQSPLQNQIQAYQQNINTNSAGTMQMDMSELSNQLQMVQLQNENISHSSSSQPTLMQPTMTVAQPSLQHLPSGDHIIEHDIEPSVEVDVVKDIPVSVRETVPDDRPAEDQSIATPKADAVEDKAVSEQEKKTIAPMSEIDFSQKLPTEWSVEDVCDFVRSIPDCQDYSEEFKSHEIDGIALLLLKVDHIVNCTSMKFGPALTLISLINDMKEKRKIFLRSITLNKL